MWQFQTKQDAMKRNKARPLLTALVLATGLFQGGCVRQSAADSDSYGGEWRVVVVPARWVACIYVQNTFVSPKIPIEDKVDMADLAQSIEEQILELEKAGFQVVSIVPIQSSSSAPGVPVSSFVSVTSGVLIIARAFRSVSEEVYLRWAKQAMEKEFYRRATRYFTKAIEKNPKLASAYYERGRAYIASEEYEKAVADHVKACELDSTYQQKKDKGYSMAYERTARTLYNQKKSKSAVDRLKQAILLDPDNHAALNYLAWLYVSDPRLRNPKAALRLATRAVQLAKSASYMDTLACAYAENGDFQKAASLEEEAVRLETQGREKKKLAKRVLLFRRKKTFLESLREPQHKENNHGG